MHVLLTITFYFQGRYIKTTKPDSKRTETIYRRATKSKTKR